VWVCLLLPAFVCVWPRLLFVLLSVQPRLLRLSAPMLFGMSLVPLCNALFVQRDFYSHLPRRLVVGDVSVIHPASGSCARAAARLPGRAAARRDAAKERAYWRVSSGLHFVPLSVELFGRLGAPALSLLRSLADHECKLGALASLGTPSSRRRSRSSASPCAAATHPWAGPACTPSLGRSAGPRCATSPVPRPRWSEVVHSCLLDGLG
jgi:hypothetical protein